MSEEFGRRVEAISGDQWSLPTPNPEWDVRALVHHLVYENVWTPPMMEGRTMEEVGDRFEGDILGDDPKVAFTESSRVAVDAVAEPGAMERTIHLSFGDYPGSEYTMQLAADHLIHAWDLARAIGADERLDAELVSALRGWFESREEFYRQAGVIGPRQEIPDGVDEQTTLLAMFGRKA
jgi:uncharacterized protein (TIGR03086 family)